MYYCMKCQKIFDINENGLKYHPDEWGAEKKRAKCPDRSCGGFVYDIDENIIPLVEWINDYNNEQDLFEVVPVNSCAGHWSGMIYGEDIPYIMVLMRHRDATHLWWMRDASKNPDIMLSFYEMFDNILHSETIANHFKGRNVEFMVNPGHAIKNFATRNGDLVDGWEGAWVPMHIYYRPVEYADEYPFNMTPIQSLKCAAEWIVSLTKNVQELFPLITEELRKIDQEKSKNVMETFEKKVSKKKKPRA